MKNYLVIAGIALVVALAVVALVPRGVVNQVSPQSFGALAGPDIPSPYLRWGNLAIYQAHPAMVLASSTLCAMQSPAATSTLTFAAWNINVGSSTASTIDMATSTTAFSTTTNIVAGISVAAGAQKSVAWVPTATNQSIMSPNTWVTVMTDNGDGATNPFTYIGSCAAEFTVIGS